MNNSPWPMVTLGKVLSLSIDAVPVDPLQTYRIAGVYSFARGLLKREPLLGSNTTYKVFHRLHKDDFVISQPKAWEGALARITSEFDGWFLSPVFPTFRVIPERLDIRYLEWYCRQAKVWNQLKNKARGIGARRESVLPKQFLSLQIPLPPLAEQRRIVARIETLAAKVEAARTLREQATAEVGALSASAADTIFRPKSNWRMAKVGDFCEKPQYGYTESASRQPIGPRFLRITDIQNGQVNWESVPFCNCPDPEKYLLKENDILFARTGGTTGKSYLVKECPQAVFASYLIRLRVEKWVTPDYLYCYFQSPSYWQQVIDNKKGTGQPNVNGRKLAEIDVPIPPLPEQHRIVAHLDALQTKLALVQQHQSATQARLEALLPSILDKAFKGEL